MQISLSLLIGTSLLSTILATSTPQFAPIRPAEQSLPVKVEIVQEEVKVIADTPNLWKKEDIVNFIEVTSSKYGVNSETVFRVIQCESQFNPKAVNWADNHKLSKGSHGIAQFSRETFNHYSKQSGIEHGDPYNPKDALETMIYMFSIGQQGHWTCYRKTN